MSLSQELYQSTRLFLNWGKDGSPVNSDEFHLINNKILQLTRELYVIKGSSIKSEAEICLSLLIALTVLTYEIEEREQKRQTVLNRIHDILPQLETSLLKCELLLWSYAILKKRELLLEAREIIISWGGRELTKGEKGLIEWHNEIIE